MQKHSLSLGFTPSELHVREFTPLLYRCDPPTMESTLITVSLFFPSSALARPLEGPLTSSAANVTLPAGSTNHGDPHLLCTPASWFTIASFILANYVAHSATTPTYPGERIVEKALAFATSFLFPAAGVTRGLNTIARGIMVLATPGKSELQQAAAAGALCMVIRTSEWTPAPGTGSVVHGVTHQGDVDQAATALSTWRVDEPHWLQPTDFLPRWPLVDEITNRRQGAFESMRKIHGTKIELPVGYAYTLVPPTALIKPVPPLPASTSATTDIAQSRDFVKVLVALFQVIYSSWTLYEARGNQIELYGFFSFSLTVAPYAVMSAINLMGGLLVPVYPTVFLVRSEVMDEVERRCGGKCFGGVVGSLQLAQNVNSLILTTGQVTDEDIDSALALCLEPLPALHNNSQVSIPACARFERIDLRVGCLTLGREGPVPFVLSPNDNFRKLFTITFSFLYRASALFGLIFIINIITFYMMIFLSGSHVRISNQQLWILVWLTGGWGGGLVFGLTTRDLWSHIDKPRRRMVNEMILRMIFCAPAIGGLVVVGKMIKEYGDCRRL